MDSMGHLHFDSSARDFRYRASKFLLRDSPFARKLTGLIKVFPLGCYFLLKVEKISDCSRVSITTFTLSCMCMVLCLKTASRLSGRCNGE